MNAVSRCCAIVSLLLLTTPSYALEPFATYDDFTSALLTPVRWYGGEFLGRDEEAIRMVEGGKLRMAYRAYGNKGSDTGTRPAGLQLFLLRKVAAITALKATVRVSSPTATGCTANTATTSSRIGFQGSFFNTDTPMPGLSANDVRAGIGVFASPSEPGVLRVLSFVIHCHDTSCLFSFTSLGSNDLGAVSVGTNVMLQMQWDPPNNQFLFQRDSQAPVSVSYGSLPDTAKPGFGFKILENAHNLENCVANPRPQGFIDGTFDDVQVNQSAS